MLALFGAAALLLGLDLAGRDVHALQDVAWYPRCPIFHLLHVQCPGCGATRAVHALLHGDLRRALDHNALFVALVLPVSAYLYLGAWRRALTGRPWPLGTPRIQLRITAVAVVLLLGFFAARNVPIEPFVWLAPG